MQLILINKNNETIDLLNNRDKFVLSACESLHGIDTEIQEISSPYLDGTQIEGVKALSRGISMTFKLIPDIKDSIEFFTSVVKSKQFVTLQETEKGNTITIQGVAKIPPYTRMMAMCEIQLDIYCGQPYWEDLNQVVADISMFIPLWHLVNTGQWFLPIGRSLGIVDTNATKTFTNDGDAEVGMNIVISILNEVDNVAIGCSTGNQNGNYMVINTPLNTYDEIEINTVRGNKYIKINGETEYNGQPVLSYLEFNGKDWLQLETGDNTFKIGEWTNNSIVPSSNFYFTITYKRRYE